MGKSVIINSKQAFTQYHNYNIYGILIRELYYVSNQSLVQKPIGNEIFLCMYIINSHQLR